MPYVKSFIVCPTLGWRAIAVWMTIRTFVSRSSRNCLLTLLADQPLRFSCAHRRANFLHCARLIKPPFEAMFPRLSDKCGRGLWRSSGSAAVLADRDIPAVIYKISSTLMIPCMLLYLKPPQLQIPEKYFPNKKSITLCDRRTTFFLTFNFRGPF